MPLGFGNCRRIRTRGFSGNSGAPPWFEQRPAGYVNGRDGLSGEIRERERQADFLAAQVVEIADTVREGKKVRVSAKGGVTEEHGDMVDRRLMVDARKWLGAPDCRIYQAKGLKRARLPNIRSERIIATPKCN
jgi:hypothetical protein